MSEFAVLVASSDDRKDIFDICFANANRIWKDCPWPRYAGFNSPFPDQDGFAVVTSPAKDWCRAVADYVDALPDEIRYVLLMVEDALFMRSVDMPELDKVAREMAMGGLSYVRLVPVRRRLRAFRKLMALPKTHSTLLEFIHPDEPYYSSTEMAIWERGYLRRQLDKPGDAWSFEHHVSKDAHWAVRRAVFDQHQIVNKGRWRSDAPRLIAQAIGTILGPEMGRGMEAAIADVLSHTRPFQTRWSALRGFRENLSFALFGFASFRIKRWLRG